jgi:hypothetical protein
VREQFAYVIGEMDPTWSGKGIPAGRMLHVFDVTNPLNVLQVDKNDLSGTHISGVAVANGHVFRPDSVFMPGAFFASIYRIDVVPGVGPTFGMERNRDFFSPILWTTYPGPILSVRNPGFNDFTLMKATSVTNWQPYASVFSKLNGYFLPSYNLSYYDPPVETVGFYRATELVTPAAMALRWKAAGIKNYQFTIWTDCTFCFPPGGSSSVVTVQNGEIINAEPNTNSNLFRSIEGFFEYLQSGSGSAHLMVIRWDYQRHYPAAIDINWNVDRDHAQEIYRITNLVPLE